MGYAKNAPVIQAPSGALDRVVAFVRCGEVELKLTLTLKLLIKPLRDALVEPFLKVHNKRAASPVTWEDIKCIKVDDYVLDEPSKGQAAAVLTKEEVRVLLLPNVTGSLIENFLAVAREEEPITRENYQSPPPRKLTRALIRIATSAADVDAQPLDADTSRRCSHAFEAIVEAERAAAEGAAVEGAAGGGAERAV